MIFRKSLILRKNLDLIFFSLILMCIYQFFAVFFNYDIVFSSIIFYIIFGFSFVFLLLNFVFEKNIVKYGYIISFSFVFLIFFTLFCQNTFLPELFDVSGKSGLDHVKSFAIGGLSWFAIGMAISFSNHYNYNNKLSWLLALILLFMFYKVLNGGLVIQYSYLASGRGYDFYLDHLILGSFALIIIAFVNSFSNKNPLIFFFISLFIFFSIGGRGDLIIFFISSIIFFLIYNRDIFLRYSFLSILILFFIFNNYFLFKFNDVDRMISIFNFTTDASFLARLELFISSLDDLLSEQFIFGNPNVLILKNHSNPDLSYSLGALSHNLISVWQFYGVFVFAFCLHYLIRTTHFIKENKIKLTDPISKFGVYLFIFTSLSIIFTKSVTYYPFWFSMGFWTMRTYNYPFKW